MFSLFIFGCEMKMFTKLNTKKGFGIFENFFLLFKIDVRKQDEKEWIYSQFSQITNVVNFKRLMC